MLKIQFFDEIYLEDIYFYTESPNVEFTNLNKYSNKMSFLCRKLILSDNLKLSGAQCRTLTII